MSLQVAASIDLYSPSVDNPETVLCFLVVGKLLNLHKLLVAVNYWKIIINQAMGYFLSISQHEEQHPNDFLLVHA